MILDERIGSELREHLPALELLCDYRPFITVFFVTIDQQQLIVFIPVIEVQIWIETVSIPE